MICSGNRSMKGVWSVVFLVFGMDLVFCQWASRVYLEDFGDYFHKVMTEAVHLMEERHWSSFKLDDYSVNLDQEMYKWHVKGNITYKNGFLVSIQKIDLSGVEQRTETSSVNGVSQTLAIVRGTLNFNDITVGYDVIAQFEEDGDHTYTGTYKHTKAHYQFSIRKNLHTQEITTDYSANGLTGGASGARMMYMPASHLTEVISRTYQQRQAQSSVTNWGRDIIEPIILDVATNKIPFPEVCLDCR